MATNAEKLQNALDNYVSQLEAISANPKLTYNIDGESWSWTDYQKFLTEQIRNLRQLIEEESGDGIVEEVTEFFT